MRYTILILALLWAQQEEGKQLFQQRCAACHKLETKLIGPPLAGIGKRRTEEWFVRFVSNSQAMIQAGDAQATAIYKEYNQQVMPPFTDLSPQQLKALWAYLNSVSVPEAPAPAAASPNPAPKGFYPGETRRLPPEERGELRLAFWLLTGLAVFVALLIAQVIWLVSEKKASSEG
ncbi:MAG: cytochrome c [Bacteroidia bacterium]|nr:cytochrome c [Bacteroidia bacterium]MDW8236568.1 cytochrome c [Bacteroidia bacterium]